MPSIALPTAEKQDKIYDLVLHQTAGKTLIPDYKEEMDIIKQEYLPSAQIPSYITSILFKDDINGIYITYRNDTNTLYILDSKTYKVKTALTLAYPLSYTDTPGTGIAYDGTYLYCISVVSSTQHSFTTVNINAKVVSYKESFNPTNVRVANGIWALDRTTGYLYIADQISSKVYIMKDPSNVMAFSDDSVITVTLSDILISGCVLIDQYLYIIGTYVNTNTLYVFKLNKTTLATVASGKYGTGSKLITPLVFVSNDMKYMFVIFHIRPNGKVLRVTLNNLSIVNITGGENSFNGYITNTWFDGISYLYTIKVLSDNKYYLDVVDGMTGRVIASRLFRNSLDPTALRALSFDTNTGLLSGLSSTPNNEVVLNTLGKTYYINFYRETLEGEVL